MLSMRCIRRNSGSPHPTNQTAAGHQQQQQEQKFLLHEACDCAPPPHSCPHHNHSMQSIVQLLHSFRSDHVRDRLAQAFRSPDQVPQKRADFSWLQTFEKPLYSLQSLMFWERPDHTILFLLFFHCSYWYLIWSGRVTSFLFTAAFTLSLLTIWKTRIWPEIRVPLTEDQLERDDWICLHPRLLTIPEIVHICSRLVLGMHSAVTMLLLMRSQSPGRFCVLMTLILSATAFIGHVVSGAMIVYLILVTLFLSPALLSHPSASSLFHDSPIASEVDTSPEFFDAFSAKSTQGQTAELSLDRELGILTHDLERDGSSSSSSSASIRIVPSHFSARLSSSSGAADDKTDDSGDLSPVEEPFEMISSSEFRNDVPDQD